MIHFLHRIIARLGRRFGTPGGRASVALSVLNLAVYGMLGFFLFERDATLAGQPPGQALATSLWWSVVTMTTVGYGDFFPTTPGGRWLVSLPMMILGIGLLGMAIGELTTWVMDIKTKRRRGELPYTESDHILILNFPGMDFILEIVRELRADPSTADREVVVVSDAVAEWPTSLQKAGIHFVHGNPCRQAVLEQANLEGADRILILSQSPDDEACDSITLGVLVTVRAIRPHVPVVVECQHEENRKLLRNAGAEELVGAEAIRAELLVQGLQDPGINTVIEDLLTNTQGNQIYVAPVREFRGSYGELRDTLSKEGDYVFLGLIQDGTRSLMPAADTKISPGNRVIVIGAQRPHEI